MPKFLPRVVFFYHDKQKQILFELVRSGEQLDIRHPDGKLLGTVYVGSDDLSEDGQKRVSYEYEVHGATEVTRGQIEPTTEEGKLGFQIYDKSRNSVGQLTLDDKKVWHLHLEDSTLLPSIIPISALLLRGEAQVAHRQWVWTRNLSIGGLTVLAVAGAYFLYGKSPSQAQNGNGNQTVIPNTNPVISFHPQQSVIVPAGFPAYVPDVNSKYPTVQLQSDPISFFGRGGLFGGVHQGTDHTMPPIVPLNVWDDQGSVDLDQLVAGTRVTQRGAYNTARLAAELSGLKTVNHITIDGVDEPGLKQVILTFPSDQISEAVRKAHQINSSEPITVTFEFNFDQVGTPNETLSAHNPSYYVTNAGTLVDATNSQIHDFIQKFPFDKKNFIIELNNYLKNRLINATLLCPFCEKQFPRPLPIVTPCDNDSCKEQFAENGVGIIPGRRVINDRQTTDLLISLTQLTSAEAVNNGFSQQTDNMFTPFPKRFLKPDGTRDYQALHSVISKIPSVAEFKGTEVEYEKALRKADRNAPYLMNWILGSSRQHLVPVDL